MLTSSSAALHKLNIAEVSNIDTRNTYIMVRFEKNEGSIHIAWGYDEPLCGYFLAITDKGLVWAEGASREVDNICRKVAEGGGGHFFHMNTYVIGGFGHKVSEATIFAFMRRYGIDPAQICSPGKTKNPRSTDGSAKANGSAETNGPAKASIPQVDTNQKKITMVLGTGGETPEMRVDPSYTAKRRANFQQTIEDASARVIILARVDRTVIEVAQQYNIPIVREGLVPPEDRGHIIFFFAQGFYPKDFQECAHMDCRLPEKNELDKHKRCSRCKREAYCSRTCQVAHWNTHKKECQPIEQ